MRHHALRHATLAACAALMLAAAPLYAQDPNQSLQFANPMLINPAFAGLVPGDLAFNFSHRIRRGTDDLRSQVSIFEAHMPLDIDWYQGGVGLQIVSDDYGGLQRTSALVGLAWEAPLGRKVRYHHLRAGVTAGIVQTSVVDPLFVFEDMYNATLGEFSNATNEPIAGLSSPVRLDLNVGVLFYRTQKIKGNPELNYFFGASVYHANRANMGLLPSDNIPRPMRIVGLAGVKYRTRSSLDLNLNATFQDQNNSRLLTYSLFARSVFYERGVLHGTESAALSLGMNMRQQMNNVIIAGATQRSSGLESLLPFVGFEYGRAFSFALAYDLVVADNTTLNSSSGGIQFSASYLIGGRRHKASALPFPSF